MPFVKLDCGMLDSSIWVDVDARVAFITALLMAEPYEVKEPIDAIQIRSLEPLGFKVRKGWYGIVRAAGIGIINRAGMDKEAGLAALERLASPDGDSRTPDNDGRRMVRIDGGFIILNYDKYRTRDYSAAERCKRWREKNKSKGVGDTGDTRNRHDNDTQAEGEVEAEAKEEGNIEEYHTNTPNRLPVATQVADPSSKEEAIPWEVAQPDRPKSSIERILDRVNALTPEQRTKAARDMLQKSANL